MPIDYPIKNWFKERILAAKAYQRKAHLEINELIINKREGRKITLVDGEILIDFVSCSYLGLDMHPKVVSAVSNNSLKCGTTYPAARTRIQVESFIKLENLLNKIFDDKHTIVFSSMHLAHLAILPLLACDELPSYRLEKKGAYFILDKSVHASIQINIALLKQFSKVVRCDFKNIKELVQNLEDSKSAGMTPILVADSIGSMGGLNDIISILEMSEKYKGYAYLDDAHGMSILGKDGRGYTLDKLGFFHPRLILCTSLSKAYGAVGGVLALTSADDIKAIKTFGTSYIFSGPPPLSIIDAAIASAYIHLSGEINDIQKRLWDNLSLFDEYTHNEISNKNLITPIRGICIGEEFKAIEVCKIMRKKGVAVTTAMFPTVQKNESLLRIAFSSEHTRDEINLISEIANSIEKGAM